MEAPVLRVTGWSTPYPPAKLRGNTSRTSTAFSTL